MYIGVKEKLSCRSGVIKIKIESARAFEKSRGHFVPPPYQNRVKCVLGLNNLGIIIFNDNIRLHFLNQSQIEDNKTNSDVLSK